MNRMINAGLLAIAFTSLTACVGAPDGGDDDAAEPRAQEEQVGEAQEALAACNAPINANADYILNSPGCTWVSVRITNQTGRELVNWYAGIDTVTSVYTPQFCWQGHCTGGFWTRTGISGSFYGPITVSLEGVVNVAGITITPTACAGSGSGGGGTTTISGQGSDGYTYTVVLTNTYFC